MAEFDDKLNALLSNPDSMAQIMQLAQNLSGTMGGVPAAAPPPPQPQREASLSSFLGGFDPALLAKLLPLAGELNRPQSVQSKQLLHALQPYLQPQRQEKVERALQLARLIHLGRKFLENWEG